jgi:hypothetical protein
MNKESSSYQFPPSPNENIDAHKMAQQEIGGKLQVRVKEKPMLNQELYDSRGGKGKALGYITQIQEGGSPGLYSVWTNDGGDYRFEVVVESELGE